jgi:hypothetical protein
MIEVFDPFDVAADPALPTARSAIDPRVIASEFERGLPRLALEPGAVELKAIRVIRHKPGKRCVIEYDVRVERPGMPREKTTVIGKIRARRFGNEGYRMLEALWNAGFQKKSQDGISVPEPIGVLPKVRMWLQRKVAGVLSGEVLVKADGVALARRVAEALHKLHSAGIPAERSHSMADELRILHERLPFVSQARPALKTRIDRILAASDRLGASVPTPQSCGIHRDFYPAQVLVRKGRLFLLDFDLYCEGDPALDAGNFLGHMIEESLRTLGDPDALGESQQALEERFVELSGPAVRRVVQAYTTLTLVRHIYLSTQFPDRATFTERLIESCEQRLA